MRDFYCQCGNSAFFRHTQCLVSRRKLGFAPGARIMTAIEPTDATRWQVPAAGHIDGRIYRLCQNYAQYNICNWLVPDKSPHHFCTSCRSTRTMPDLDAPRHIELRNRLESTKRHLIFNLYQLGPPIIGRDTDPANGLAFDFLADADAETEFTEALAGRDPITTGHANGVITINIAEADDVARARMREQMGEHYRTLIGHFLHEVGHYYWARLIDAGAWLDEYRSLFGDERADYGASLQAHYNNGAPADWQNRFVTPYASAHPWEDWAETWAHYLHIRDTLNTATEFQLVRSPPWGQDPRDFDALMHRWTHLAIGMNAINRSMGLADAYPLVLNAGARTKLEFIYRVIEPFETG